MKNFAALTFLVLHGVASIAAPADRGVIRRTEWHPRESRAITARALTIFRSSPELQTTRMLFDAAGDRFVFTDVANARAGTTTRTIRVDKSGQWLELTHHYGLAAPTLTEWFALFHEENRPADLTVRLTVRTSGGAKFTLGEIPYIDAPPLIRVVESAISNRSTEQSIAALRQELLTGFPKPTLRLLAAAVAADDDSLGFSEVVNLVLALTDEDESLPALVVGTRARAKGTRLIDQADIEFASRFRSVANPIDPLTNEER